MPIEVPAFAGTVAFGDRLLRGTRPTRLRAANGLSNNFTRFKEDRVMAVDGTWNLTMQTPMGERRATLLATAQDATLTGKQSGNGGTTDIFDGPVNANDPSCKISMTNRRPLPQHFPD